MLSAEVPETMRPRTAVVEKRELTLCALFDVLLPPIPKLPLENGADFDGTFVTPLLRIPTSAILEKRKP